MLSRLNNPEMADTTGWVNAEAEPARVFPWRSDGLDQQAVLAAKCDMTEWERAREEGSEYEIWGIALVYKEPNHSTTLSPVGSA